MSPSSAHLDQFEELFLSQVKAEEREAFIELLYRLWQAPVENCPLQWLIALRADFLEPALNDARLAEMLRDADIKLGPMSPQALTAAIVEPAAGQGVSFADGLPERLVQDTLGALGAAGSADHDDAFNNAGSAGRLPLLQFALSELWKKQSGDLIAHAAYADPPAGIGGIRGALRTHAEGVYSALPQDKQERAQRLFRRLVDRGRGLGDVRRIVAREEVAEDWQDLVVPLAGARLLTTNESEGETSTVEIVHEALLRAWPDLRQWIADNAEFDQWRQELSLAASAWNSAPSGERSDHLLRNVRLNKALGQLADKQDEFSEIERRFIMASRDHRDEEGRRLLAQQRRRVRALGVGLSVTALVAVLAILQWLRATALETEASQLEKEAIESAAEAQEGLTAAAAANLAMGRLEDAERFQDLAAQLSAEAFGADDERTLQSQRALAKVKMEAGEYREAAALFTRVKERRSQLFGPKHPRTAESLHDLGEIKLALGAFHAADEHFRRAYEVRRDHFSEQDRATLQSLFGTALVAEALYRIDDAERTLEQVRQLRAEALGTEDPDTLETTIRIARLRISQGRFAGVEEMLEAARATFLQSLPRRNAKVLHCLEAIAYLYQEQGRIDAAEHRYQALIRESQRALGAEHPDTLRRIEQLAKLQASNGHYEASAETLRKVIQVQQETLGEHHPATTQSIDMLAGILGDAGQFLLALDLIQPALALSERVLGAEHPQTLTSRNTLAVLYKR